MKIYSYFNFVNNSKNFHVPHRRRDPKEISEKKYKRARWGDHPPSRKEVISRHFVHKAGNGRRGTDDNANAVEHLAQGEIQNWPLCHAESLKEKTLKGQIIPRVINWQINPIVINCIIVWWWGMPHKLICCVYGNIKFSTVSVERNCWFHHKSSGRCCAKLLFSSIKTKRGLIAWNIK